MTPIPVAFHIWFLEVHTYGIGLALTFWFGLRYTERRLRKAGYPWQWVTGMFLWVVVAAIFGARALHVLSNPSTYVHHPGQIFAIWQGGLSSFGGLLFAVPVAIVISRRRCPELSTMRFADLMAPVLMACWGIGRLLGPQLMYAGGGHPTNQWFGMYYAGQAGKRIPVPIIQSIEDFSIFAVLILLEHWLRSIAPTRLPSGVAADASGAGDGVADMAGGVDGTASAAAPLETDEVRTTAVATSPVDAGADPSGQAGSDSTGSGGADRVIVRPPSGIIVGVGMVLWGIERFLDEHLWLGEDGRVGSLLVQGAGILLAIAGITLLVSRLGPFQRWRRGEYDPEADERAPTHDDESESEHSEGIAFDPVLVRANTGDQASDTGDALPTEG